VGEPPREKYDLPVSATPVPAPDAAADPADRDRPPLDPAGSRPDGTPPTGVTRAEDTPRGRFDSHVFGALTDPAALRATGVELREATPSAAFSAHRPRPDRPDPVEFVERTNAGRVDDLIALRVGRMAASPFAFLRGSAGLMAADLAGTPTSGVTAWICGDAHASNFGLYASPERRLVMDVNDFDETLVGPWEWDLKRLVTSLVVAARETGHGEDKAVRAATDCARTYRAALRELAGMPVLDAFYLTTDAKTIAHFDVDDLGEVFKRVGKKARKNTSRRVGGRSSPSAPSTPGWRFLPDPPILTRRSTTTAHAVLDGVEDYAERCLDDELRQLLSRYAVADIAHRVVGLGSVGRRSYVLLLHGNGDDSLVLQVKEAGRPRSRLRRPPSPYTHDGERIVHGQRWMQTVSDIFLGWTTIHDRPYLVRQFRDMKGSIDPVLLKPGQLDDYARVVGAVLARAHAQSADPRILTGTATARRAPRTASGSTGPWPRSRPPTRPGPRRPRRGGRGGPGRPACPRSRADRGARAFRVAAAVGAVPGRVARRRARRDRGRRGRRRAGGLRRRVGRRAPLHVLRGVPLGADPGRLPAGRHPPDHRGHRGHRAQHPAPGRGGRAGAAARPALRRRFRLGVGRGGPWIDLLVFGTPEHHATGFGESLDLLLAALGGGPVRRRGTPVHLPPRSRWCPARGPATARRRRRRHDAETVELAARRGLPLLLGMHADDTEKAAMLTGWRRRPARASPSGGTSAWAWRTWPTPTRKPTPCSASACALLGPGLAGTRRADGAARPHPRPARYAARLCDIHPVGSPRRCREQAGPARSPPPAATRRAHVDGHGERTVSRSQIHRLGRVLPRLRAGPPANTLTGSGSRPSRTAAGGGHPAPVSRRVVAPAAGNPASNMGLSASS
jgi:uncharacterized protein (DUF2252 family)